jgi:hypothetical protein
VPYYAIVDRQAGPDGKEVRVVGYEAGTDGYVAVAPNSKGRVWLEPVGLWLGIADRRAVCYDKRGRRIPEPQQQTAAEARARKKAESEKVELQKRVEELEAQLRKTRSEP